MAEMMGRDREVGMNGTPGFNAEVYLMDDGGGGMLLLEDIDQFLSNWDAQSLRNLSKGLLRLLINGNRNEEAHSGEPD